MEADGCNILFFKIYWIYSFEIILKDIDVDDVLGIFEWVGRHELDTHENVNQISLFIKMKYAGVVFKKALFN